MIFSLTSGFLFGMSSILAIGGQNAFVLRQGIKRQHVFAISLTCALSDALLIALGIGGFAVVIERFPWLLPAMRYGGAAFLFIYGFRALISAWRGTAGQHLAEEAVPSLWRALLTCLMLTWLNPHVYLDTVILHGLLAANYPEPIMFGIGSAGASFLFFFLLGYGARFLAPIFKAPISWRVLDLLVAAIMWLIALKLLLNPLSAGG